MDFTQLLDGISDHPYATIILASVITGRTTAVVVGALVAEGFINPLLAYIIFVIMDILGDTIYYFFGRIGRLGGKFFIKRIGLEEKLEKLNGGLKESLTKAIFIGKIISFSKPVIITAGIAEMPLFKFYRITVPCTLVLYILYMSAGYFFCRWI